MIKDLLDFDTPNVGYEDKEKRSVCGCCRTYYVVGLNDLDEANETLTVLYEALTLIYSKCRRLSNEEIIIAGKALAGAGK